MAYDGVLLIGFGGPTPGGCRKVLPDGSVCPGPQPWAPCPEGSTTEAHCFVQGIIGKAPERAARVLEVSHHYQAIGGFSPFDELTKQQGRALQEALRRRNVALPVTVGYRFWGPFLKDVIAQHVRDGHRRLLGIVMAPHQSKVSWDLPLAGVHDALAALPEKSRPAIDVLEPWWAHAGFVGAIADLARIAGREWGERRFREAALVFTAHSIPKAVADKGPYLAQIRETAALVAKELGHAAHELAFQSGAKDGATPWVGPEISDHLRALAGRGVKDVLVAPIGFVCDHVEVLFDLDIEARQTARECGLSMARVATVGSHPKFIGMLADLVERRAKA